jgi:hypothetical protein
MNTAIQKSPFAFMALCIAAPSAALLLLYGTHHWDQSVVLSCLFLTGCLWLILLGWTVASIRRHRIRVIVGTVVCAYCLWQTIHVLSKW